MTALLSITRHAGVAGAYAITAHTSDGPVTFHGSIYGESIVMTTPGNPRGVYVTAPERFGDRLNADWVRAFFA